MRKSDRKRGGASQPHAMRRRFLRFGGVLVSVFGALAAGCTSLLRSGGEASSLECKAGDADGEFDFVVVGSGAGGGPLAAKLALAGFKVLLLEAGGDEQPLDSIVPAFHARASENDRMAWNFFVRHYDDDAQQQRDPKFRGDKNGVLYPRCAAVGGCTAHNAMVLVCPHNDDWDDIARVTGDATWRSENMRAYFERLERCAYLPLTKPNSRHGLRGWLVTTVANPALAVRDKFVRLIEGATWLDSFISAREADQDPTSRLARGLDPNGWQFLEARGEGQCLMPVTIDRGGRTGSRAIIDRVRRECPDRLVVRTHALATRVVFDANLRATGVQYMSGEHLYAADPLRRAASDPTTLTANARREVILCTGAFNTPQLLKLSGVGPREELEQLGIEVRKELPGVGEHLQDRYEISVVSRMTHDFSLMKGMKLRPPLDGEPPDPAFEEWRIGGGPYTSNGAVVSVIKRSDARLPNPDLFLFGLLGCFTGYYPGYSSRIAEEKDLFTWAILKAHTGNAQGRVRLRSKDPRDVPRIEFRYFAQGGDADLAAVVAGVRAARRINARCRDIIDEEIVPGPQVESDEQIATFIRDNAWGHHACGTCRMGRASDLKAVVDARFRVHGIRGLRIVDASVFPKIPGFFLASAVYMISEKAVDVITEDARLPAA